MNLKPGDVWIDDLGYVAKARPVIIVSRWDPDPPRALALYIPITSENRGSRYEVGLPRLPFLRDGSCANIQGLASLPIIRLERQIGSVPDGILTEIKNALRYALEI